MNEMRETEKSLVTENPPPRAPVVAIGLAVAVLALALSGWQWIEGRQFSNSLERDIGRKLAESEGRIKESLIVAARAQEESRQALVKLGMVEQKLADSQNQQLALEALYQELSRSRDEWVLAEIEQILLTANQQLQLAGNPKAALIALQTADSRLQRLDKPQFTALRKIIVRDIERLQALPAIDLVGNVLRLDNLASLVDDLPLSVNSRLPADVPPAPPPQNAGAPWTQLGREIWQDTKKLVRIQNMQTPDAPLLAPSQSYFLRENLRLRLLSARIALLRHNETTFKSDLKASEVWLRRYFDLKALPTQTALTTLKQLAAGRVNIELPDISDGLAAVRTHKLTREKGAQ